MNVITVWKLRAGYCLLMGFGYGIACPFGPSWLVGLPCMVVATIGAFWARRHGHLSSEENPS